MELEDIQKQIHKRVVLSGRVVILSVLISALFFSLILGVVYLEMLDAEKEAAALQIQTYVRSNVENFQMQNFVALKKAALMLVRSPVNSHVVVFDPSGQKVASLSSPHYTTAKDTEFDDLTVLFSKVEKGSKLRRATQGSDLEVLELPSGQVVYRAFLPISKGGEKLGEVEMGFFQSEIRMRALKRLRSPGAVCAGCTLILIFMAYGSMRRWERAKAVELSEYVTTQMEQQQGDFNKKIAVQKREFDNKDLEGGSFFNILESVREISGAPDMAMFIRRSVLSSVRLFRCRLVSFYVLDSSNGATPVWKLMGRYDGRGYTHDLTEALDVSTNQRLGEALRLGSTELLEGYPLEKTQSLLVTIASDKRQGAILMSNKVGTFDAKDVLAGRIFAGFLPNLLAWHVK